MSDHLGKEVLSYIKSNAVDATADYATRGRKHAGLSDSDLKAQWVTAFRNLADNFRNAESWQAESDLTSEFSLRGQDAPFDEVMDAMKKLSDGMKAVIDAQEGDERAGQKELERFIAFQTKQSN